MKNKGKLIILIVLILFADIYSLPTFTFAENQKIQIPRENSFKNIKEQKKFPHIKSINHNAIRTLQAGDEIEVSIIGDEDCYAYFDIGKYITGIPMEPTFTKSLEYAGTYKIKDRDNISNARITVYLMNNQKCGTSLTASATVNIKANPGVYFTSPFSFAVENKFTMITGVVEIPNVQEVTLFVNNIKSNVQVKNGAFNAIIELKKGFNIIEVTAMNLSRKYGMDRLELFCK
ncbi:MAG: hypothetical protein HY934_09940 [Candidatus Firestonebacteria bacterium]|nr:hypothetical protein [Candidatus Firestonebacteria bacterium]